MKKNVYVFKYRKLKEIFKLKPEVFDYILWSGTGWPWYFVGDNPARRADYFYKQFIKSAKKYKNGKDLEDMPEITVD